MKQAKQAISKATYKKLKDSGRYLVEYEQFDFGYAGLVNIEKLYTCKWFTKKLVAESYGSASYQYN